MKKEALRVTQRFKEAAKDSGHEQEDESYTVCSEQEHVIGPTVEACSRGKQETKANSQRSFLKFHIGLRGLKLAAINLKKYAKVVCKVASFNIPGMKEVKKSKERIQEVGHCV